LFKNSYGKLSKATNLQFFYLFDSLKSILLLKYSICQPIQYHCRHFGHCKLTKSTPCDLRVFCNFSQTLKKMSYHIHFSASDIQSIEYLCLGWLDGFHKVHQDCFERLKDQVPGIMERMALLCFDSLGSEEDLEQEFLNSFSEKLALLKKTGIEKVIRIPIPAKVNRRELLTAIEIVLNDLPNIKTLIAPGIIDGPFENLKAVEFMQTFMPRYNCTFIETPSDSLQAISTPAIKKLLKDGDVKKAAEMLGYPYTLEGMVVEGNQIGRTLGFPTANLKPSWEGKVIPAIGVYAVKAFVQGTEHQAMLNIGIRPTLNLKAVTIEAHLLGFEGELYHKPMRIEFLQRIRDEKRFTGLEELKKQLFVDRQAAIEIFTAASL